MELDLLDLYRRASEWTGVKVAEAVTELDAPTLCDGWTVRMLMNHMLETQRYFVGTAQGEDASPPSAIPPEIMSDDPGADFERARIEALRTFGEPGVIERTGPALGIVFSDQLLHGWDLAASTAQDSTMPEGLPEAAYAIIHGQFSDNQRKGVFKSEVAVASDSSAQNKLLGYTGRDPVSAT
jgi:uncharacterized protein (TIGR03086 family)